MRRILLKAALFVGGLLLGVKVISFIFEPIVRQAQDEAVPEDMTNKILTVDKYRQDFLKVVRDSK
jgi:hypothetical protein